MGPYNQIATGEGPRDNDSETEELHRSSRSAPSSNRTVGLAPYQHRYEPITNVERISGQPKVSSVSEESQTSKNVTKEQEILPKDVGLLSRGRFHWSFLVPLDILLAMSPTFFFGTTSHLSMSSNLAEFPNSNCWHLSFAPGTTEVCIWREHHIDHAGSAQHLSYPLCRDIGENATACRFVQSREKCNSRSAHFKSLVSRAVLTYLRQSSGL